MIFRDRAMKKVNASICAPPTTDHDPAGAIPDRKRNFVIFDFSCGPMVVGINTCRNIFCIFYLWTQFRDFACNHVRQNGMFFRVEERTKVIFQGVSPTYICRFPLQFFGSCARGSRLLDCSLCDCSKSFHLIHVSPHFARFTVVSALLHLISCTCTWFVYLSSSIHCHSASTVMLWPMRWTIPSHKFGARRLNWGSKLVFHNRNRHTLKMTHGCQMAGRAAILTYPAL